MAVYESWKVNYQLHLFILVSLSNLAIDSYVFLRITKIDLVGETI